jgi:Kef-type K+ transport system membrane component KefB
VIDPAAHGQFNALALAGLAVCCGAAAAKLVRKLHVPQIIGYMAAGVVLGPLLKFFSPQAVTSLEPACNFALALIGFMIGGELNKDLFARFGRQVLAILAFEGIAAFCLVAGASLGILLCFYDWPTALAGALVLGAICAATDPASTVNILWEYKTRGPLTSMLTAVVALDDVLALLLYVTCVSAAGVVTGRHDGGAAAAAFGAVYEVAGSLALGIIGGLVLRWILSLTREVEAILVFAAGCIVLAAGFARNHGFDTILVSMAMGTTLANMAPRRSAKCFELIRSFSAPVYVLFFVLIGARLNVSVMSGRIWLLAAAYVASSIVGKTAGAYCGAVYSQAGSTIRKYLGLCLYQQGTVAVALLIMASSRFEGPMRDVLVGVIVISVFVLQFVGPLFVKTAVSKAGETGLNITEEDLIETYKVSDVMDSKVPVMSAGLSISELLRVVSGTAGFYWPVVDTDGKLIGAVTLDGIKNTFSTQELNEWLVALDIAEPVVTTVTPGTALADAFDKAGNFDVDHVPVVAADAGDKFVGLLNCRAVRRQIAADVLARQQKADSTRGLGR